MCTSNSRIRVSVALCFVLVLGGISCHKNDGNPVTPNWQFSGGIIFEGQGICVINPAEASPAVHQLIPQGSEPRISPDGKKLLQSRQPGNTHDVFVSAPDGSSAIDLTKTDKDASESDADWAPDMRHVAAHVLLYPSYNEVLRVISTDGSGTFTNLTDTTRVRTVNLPRYAPDGTKIAYIAQDSIFAPWELAIISSDGSSDQRYGNCGGGFAPVWSPDSKLLVYSYSYSDGTLIRLRVLELSTGQVGQVSPGAVAAASALWLSNTRLVYCSWDGTLYQVNAATITPPFATGDTTIASGFQSLEAIVLSPHGDRLAIFGRRNGETALGLYLVALDGSDLHRVVAVDSSPHAFINRNGYIQWVE